MNDSAPISFRSLAGVEPGVTTMNEIRDRFGDPESQTTTAPYTVAGGYPGGDLIWHYESQGVRIFVHRDDVDFPNPVVDEVHVRAPYSEKLSFGLYVGQSLESARDLIARLLQITDEYEDSIYFTTTSEHLHASIENRETNQVVTIELMRLEKDRAA